MIIEIFGNVCSCVTVRSRSWQIVSDEVTFAASNREVWHLLLLLHFVWRGVWFSIWCVHELRAPSGYPLYSSISRVRFALDVEGIFPGTWEKLSEKLKKVLILPRSSFGMNLEWYGPEIFIFPKLQSWESREIHLTPPSSWSPYVCPCVCMCVPNRKLDTHDFR